MKNHFVVKTTLTKEDTLALAKQQLKKNKLFTWLCCLLLAVGTIVNAVRGGENTVIYAGVTVVMAVLSLFWDKIVGLTMFKNANKAAGETTYTITDADVHMHCALNEGSIPFDTFTDLVETDAYFFLYIQKSAAFILPKKDFTEGSVEAFRAFIARKVKKPMRRARG